MRNLQVNIKLIEQPLNGDSFGFTVKKNGQNIIYDTTGFSAVNKTFTNTLELQAGKIVRLTNQLAYDNLNFKAFNNNVTKIIPFQGDLLVCGVFTAYDGTPTSQLVRLSTTGDFISSIGTFTGTINVVKEIQGKIYVGGNFVSPNGNYLLRFNIDGTPDAAYNNFVGNNFNGQVYDIELLFQDKIAVGGAFTSYQGFTNQKYLVPLNPDGTIFSIWNTVRPNGTVKVLLADANILWIGGTFTDFAGFNNRILSSVNKSTGFNNSPELGFVGDEVNSLKKVGNHLFVGGDFSGVLGETRGSIAKIFVGPNSTGIPAIDITFDTVTSVNNIVYALEYDEQNEELLVGGSFTTYKGVNAYRFIKLDNTATMTANIDFNNTVSNILFTDNGIYVGGVFTLIEGGTNINVNFIEIQASKTLTADETEINLETYNNISGSLNYARFSEVVGLNVIEGIQYIYEFDDDDIVTISEINQVLGRVEIEIFNESLTIQDLTSDLRARSPQLYKSIDNNLFDTTQFKIWTYRGDIFNYAGTTPTYTKTKQKILPTQDTIFINISDLVKEKLESSISNYINNSSGIQPTNLDNNRWVRVEAQNYLLNEEADDSTRFYYVTDGYKDYNDLSVNLPNLLMTGRKRYYNKNSIKRLFFKTPNLLSVLIIDGLDITLISGVTEIGNSVDWVKNIGLNDFNTNNARLSFTYTTGVEVMEIELNDRCSKYDLVDLVFKNKYGFLETLSFDKLSKKTLDITKSDYNRSIVDFNGNFDLNRHTKKDFNVTGRTSILLNTDWIPEYMNPVFQELMLSEEVYMVENEILTPVNIKDTSITYKTQLNDKLINYTINVEVSHEQIQNFI